MATSLVDDRRIRQLNSAEPRSGSYVLYWMQAAVRTRENHALEHAVRTANDLEAPLVVCFGLDAEYADAQPPTFRFLVDGLADVATGLARRNITLVVRSGAPLAVAEKLAGEAAAVVVDRAYLRAPRRWRRDLADSLDVPIWEVDTNLVVPVDVASDKREWAARTIRPKIHEHLDDFLVELTTTSLDDVSSRRLDSLDATDPAVLLEAIGVAPEASRRFEGGEIQADAALDRFIEEGLPSFPGAGTRVQGDVSSHLSMYLHYGHLSPARAVRKVRASGASRQAKEAFVEQLAVRRELAHNYVWHEPDYDQFGALPEWSRTTLDEHRDDERPEIYTKGELEDAATSDRYWNAAMIEMKVTGYLHNRMRMYWGKRILEWTNTPRYAYRVALELNNRYFLDGRDANSYANVGWLFGLHDQAFEKRDIIGKVRPLTRSGLERKIDTDAYVAFVEELSGRRVEGD